MKIIDDETSPMVVNWRLRRKLYYVIQNENGGCECEEVSLESSIFSFKNVTHGLPTNKYCIEDIVTACGSLGSNSVLLLLSPAANTVSTTHAPEPSTHRQILKLSSFAQKIMFTVDPVLVSENGNSSSVYSTAENEVENDDILENINSNHSLRKIGDYYSYSRILWSPRSSSLQSMRMT